MRTTPLPVVVIEKELGVITDDDATGATTVFAAALRLLVALVLDLVVFVIVLDTRRRRGLFITWKPALTGSSVQSLGILFSTTSVLGNYS